LNEGKVQAQSQLTVGKHQTADQFSFDTLVLEVNTIVEDLRWLHLELTLRNKISEVFFLETSSYDRFMSLTFEGVREKLGLLELSVYIRVKGFFRISFREIEESVFWDSAEMPWLGFQKKWSAPFQESRAVLTPDVNHYTVNSEALTTIAVPVVLNKTVHAALFIVTHSSNIIPRLRKLFGGLSGTLGLALNYFGAKETTNSSTLTQLQAQDNLDGMPESEEAPFLEDLTDEGMTRLSRSAVYFCTLANDLSVTFMNPSLENKTGTTPAKWHGSKFLDQFLPPYERESIEHMLQETLDRNESSQTSVHFHLRSSDGSMHLTSWIIVAEPVAGNQSAELWLIGSPAAEASRRPYETESASPMHHHDASLFSDATLAKQYRFLMKYVPFPLFHLEENSGIIRNANPAFEQLIGTKNWVGLSLSDFGNLEIRETSGEAKPCVFYVLSSGGITLPYRGVSTSLLMYGKHIQEVKLDPIEE